MKNLLSKYFYFLNHLVFAVVIYCFIEVVFGNHGYNQFLLTICQTNILCQQIIIQKLIYLNMHRVIVKGKEKPKTKHTSDHRVLPFDEKILQPDCNFQLSEGFMMDIMEGEIHLLRINNVKMQKINSHIIMLMNCSDKNVEKIQERKEQIQMIDVIMCNGVTTAIIVFKSIAVASEYFHFLEHEALKSEFLPLYLESATILYPKMQKNSSFAIEQLIHADVELQIPTCFTCLDVLDSEVTGLNIIHRSKEIEKNCLVCWKRKGQATCIECNTAEENWICMICGMVNCGRYKNADAQKHNIVSGHHLSLDIQTNSIWNYQSDCFCHKIAGKEENKMEISEIEDDGEKAFWEYCSIVSEQLQKQRNFYEQIIKEESIRFKSAVEELERKEQSLAKAKEEKLQLLKKQLKKNKKNEKKNKQLKEKCIEERQVNSCFEEVVRDEKMVSPLLASKRAQLQALQSEISQILMNIS